MVWHWSKSQMQKKRNESSKDRISWNLDIWFLLFGLHKSLNVSSCDFQTKHPFPKRGNKNVPCLQGFPRGADHNPESNGTKLRQGFQDKAAVHLYTCLRFLLWIGNIDSPHWLFCCGCFFCQQIQHLPNLKTTYIIYFTLLLPPRPVLDPPGILRASVAPSLSSIWSPPFFIGIVDQKCKLNLTCFSAPRCSRQLCESTHSKRKQKNASFNFQT